MDFESLSGKWVGDHDVVVVMRSKHRSCVELCPDCGDKVVV